VLAIGFIAWAIVMDEKEWLACTDPTAMLEFVRGKASDRKLRLFAVACCRRLGAELPDQRSWDAVHVAECFADGNGTEHDLMIARRDAEASFQKDRTAYAAVQATGGKAWDAAVGAVEAVDYLGWEWYEEGVEREQVQTGLLREIFGNPFRPVALDPAWRLSNVIALAKPIYDDRAFDRLPVLAEALEEACCDSQDILNHFRGPGPHVLGCWALDLLLGKS
jgi:hypothetical protein